MSSTSDKISQVIKEAVLKGSPLNENYKKRIPLRLDMDLQETILIMAEETPGAQRVLEKIQLINPMVILDLDDMNIRGQQIYVAFSEFAEGKIDNLMNHARARSQPLVSFLCQKFPHIKCVKRGGAPK